MYQTISTVSRLLLGAVFVFTAVAHLKNPFLFLDSIFAYQIAGGYLAVVAAAILPMAEITLAIFFFSQSSKDVPFWIAYFLFGVFLTTQCYALISGLKIDCGCFGGVIQREVGMKSVLFLISLIGICFAGHWCSVTGDRNHSDCKKVELLGS